MTYRIDCITATKTWSFPSNAKTFPQQWPYMPRIVVELQEAGEINTVTATDGQGNTETIWTKP